MQNLLNHNGEQATIKVLTGHPVEHRHHTINKTWEQLTDSDKQDIASKWIKDHVYCNVHQVMELLAKNDDHCDFEEYLSIAEYQDFEEVSTDHINDLSIDALIEVIEEYDLESDVNHVELFKTKYLNDLIENFNNTNIGVHDLYNELLNTLLLAIDHDIDWENFKTLKNTFIDAITNKLDQFSFDDLDTCISNLSINFDGYLKAYQSDLSTLIIANIDLDQYGQDNNLDPEYQHAYEFWSVSDHFVSMLKDTEQCSKAILGLSVWARYCTGQAICLDVAIQEAAFKALSDCSYTYY